MPSRALDESNEKAGRKKTHDIETDLSSNREGQPVIGKLLLEDVDEGGSDLVDLVVGLEIESLLDAIYHKEIENLGNG